MAEASEGATISGSGQKVTTQGTTVATDVVPEGTLTIPPPDSKDRPGREWTKGMPEGHQGEESGTSNEPGEGQEEPTATTGESLTPDQTAR